MDVQQATAALAEAERRRQQTVAAGAAPWSWRLLGVWGGALVAFGLTLDFDLVWLGAVILVGAVLAGGQRAVRLRGRRTPWRSLALAAALAVLMTDIVVQALVRWADGPLPNACGALAGALLLLLIRPLQARIAAARRL